MLCSDWFKCWLRSTGYYIYIETSSAGSGRKPGDVARIASQRVIQPSSSGSCIQFWYHMYGEHVRQLSVKLVSQLGAGKWCFIYALLELHILLLASIIC